MTFDEAATGCLVRGLIYRKAKPEVKWGKNHTVPLAERVPVEDQAATDWCDADPEGEATSIVG